MTKTEIQKLVSIAKKHYLIPDYREDLKSRSSDSLDFMDCAVWNIEAALIEAFEAGKAAAENKK